MDSKMIIIGVLLAIFVACAVAYGLWLRKGDEEDKDGASR